MLVNSFFCLRVRVFLIKIKLNVCVWLVGNEFGFGLGKEVHEGVGNQLN